MRSSEGQLASCGDRGISQRHSQCLVNTRQVYSRHVSELTGTGRKEKRKAGSSRGLGSSLPVGLHVDDSSFPFKQSGLVPRYSAAP